MIRLLIVDDSALMRKLLGRVFAAEADFQLAFARDGLEALAEIERFQPDVVTLDVQMPGMDGLACLDRIMVQRPRPVVMVSALTADGAAETLEALEIGAVDFIAKPSAAVSLDIDELAPPLVEKVRAAARARVRTSRRLADRVRLRLRDPSPAPDAAAQPGPPADTPAARPSLAQPGAELVLVGCSTGGPPALEALLAPLSADFPCPILVAQHMPASFTAALARRLDGMCALQVTEIARPTRLEPGHAYIARGDADVLVTVRGGRPTAMPAPPSSEHRWHPSVDRMVESALAHIPAARLIGVLMTGMGVDGAATLARLHAQGGRTLAESEDTAVVWGMPGTLARSAGADVVAPLDRIAEQVIAWAHPTSAAGPVHRLARTGRS